MDSRVDRGQGIPWKGNYSSWLEQKQERLRKEERAESQRQKTLERELEWIRMSPKARHAKGKARINAYESLLNQEVEKQSAEMEIYIPPGPRLGDVVIEADQVSKGYGDRLLFEGLSFQLPPGGIVGVIGLTARANHVVQIDHQTGAGRRRNVQDRLDGRAWLR